LQESLGLEHYLAIEPSLTILSRKDLTSTKNMCSSDIPKQSFGILRGKHKKDIRKALLKGDSLENTILVDNDISYVYNTQEKNFLWCPTGFVANYRNLKESDSNPKRAEYKNKELFLKFNTIFYLAGMLEACIEQFEKGFAPTSFLFDRHFKRSPNNFFEFTPNYDFNKNEGYYKKGLKCLKTVNPDLCFVSQDDYMKILSVPVFEDEEKIIDESRACDQLLF